MNGSRRGNEADGCARLPGNPPCYLGGYHFSDTLLVFLVGWSQFLGCNGEIELLGVPDDGEFRRNANCGTDQMTMQIINPGNGFSLKRHDNVSLAQSGAAGGAAGFEASHQNTVIDSQSVEPNNAPVNGHVLPGHTDPTAAYAAFLDQPGGHELRGVAGNGKTNSLGGM